MIITLTSVQLKSLWRQFSLFSLVVQIIQQTKSQKGFIKMETSKGLGYTHYTISVWNNEADLRAFARSGAHLKAMKESSKIATRVTTYTYQTEIIPDLASAKKLLKEKGKVLTY
jgi:heme-degrading monooxygenase HmoA